MDIILVSLIVSGIVILLLAAVNAFLFKLVRKTDKEIEEVLESGKIKDFKDIFLSQKNKNDSLEKEIQEAFLKIDNLQNLCETTIRKIGIVRFNPFNDMGGNQSFAIAMLDNKDNGFLISSLFTKEGNRVYAKTVKKGKSEHVLSNEEVEAIAKATNFESFK